MFHVDEEIRLQPEAWSRAASLADSLAPRLPQNGERVAVIGCGNTAIDAATQARSRWQPTWPSAGVVTRMGFTVPPLLAIDHVLVNDGLRAVRTDSYVVGYTDHRALVATLVP